MHNVYVYVIVIGSLEVLVRCSNRVRFGIIKADLRRPTLNQMQYNLPNYYARIIRSYYRRVIIVVIVVNY